MEFGLFLMNVDFKAVRESARAAEELGYHLVVFPDHIVNEGPQGYDPHGLAYDSILLAAAAAEATRTLRIGHVVLCNLFRHPAITAQALMSLDHLSGGRLLAGLGAGWTETEFRMTGIGFPDIGTRLRMLDEALTCIRSLWTQERTTFEGEFYRLNDAILWPEADSAASSANYHRWQRSRSAAPDGQACRCCEYRSGHWKARQADLRRHGQDNRRSVQRAGQVRSGGGGAPGTRSQVD